jgi:putative ABC transport system substrate-binding protein
MRRREFIIFVSGVVAGWPLAARAQPASSVRKIGVLWPGASPPAPPRMESFRQGLLESGFVEGQNVLIELRYAEKGLDQLPELAAELVRLKVEVIEASGDFAPRVAQQTTSTIPIVAFSDDVLGAGLISSLSRPGGNTTGLTIFSPELSAKRLEVLSVISAGPFTCSRTLGPTTGQSQVALTEDAAKPLKIKLQVLEVRKREELVEAFKLARSERAEALNVFSSPFLASLYREIIALAAENRLPAIYQWREHAEAGGLLSYGPSLAELWRQVGVIVGKILKGAKPAEMPVEQPTKFELVVNARTAQSLGLTIPQSIYLRADHTIE